MKYTYIICSVLFCLFSCNTENKKQEDIQRKENTEEFFFPNYEIGDIKNDTLYLEVMIDECGEFGGPSDKFKIYVDSRKQYHLEYKRFRFNCDSIEYYYDLKTKPVEFKGNIPLNKKAKEVTSLFLENLLRGKISERVYSNGGSYYHLHSSDSTLNISIHSENKRLEEDYFIFKKELGFSEHKRNLLNNK